MTTSSVTDRCLSFLKWLSDDIKSAWLLARYPNRYTRWHSSGNRARLAEGGRLWIVAADVAQIYVGVRFVEELRRRHPGLKCIYSVADQEVRAAARRRVHPDDIVTYIPLPLSVLLWRALSLVRPVAVVSIMSMEAFYLLRIAKGRGVPVAWIAAETAESHSERLRQFWRRFDVRRTIEAVDVICANTDKDLERLVALGFDAARIVVTGPAKYDAAVPQDGAAAAARAVLQVAGVDRACPIFLGGSLAEGEDEALLSIFPALKAQFERLVLILVPRNAARANGIARRAAARGLRVLLRSEIGRAENRVVVPPDVVVIDTIGDLKDLYACATVVFLGRSLTDRTGSNFMEPAAWSKPIVIGPRFEHFEEEIGMFLSAGAVRQVADAETLRQAVAEFLGDPALRQSYGGRAHELVTRHAGSVRRTVDQLDRHGFFRAPSVPSGRATPLADRA